MAHKAKPMTAPARKATLKAAVRREGGSDAAATVVRALASTAIIMPQRPEAMDVKPPTRKATVVKRPSSKDEPQDVSSRSSSENASRNCTQMVYSARRKA